MTGYRGNYAGHKQEAHGPVSERIMRKFYGPAGIPKPNDEVSEDARVEAVKFCRERNLNYTLGMMLEMARFADEYTAKIAKHLRLAQEHGAKAEIRAINTENARRRRD
jgi:hypothetical protein